VRKIVGLTEQLARSEQLPDLESGVIRQPCHELTVSGGASIAKRSARGRSRGWKGRSTLRASVSMRQRVRFDIRRVISPW
jgi:hypothetical protein